MHAVNPVSKGRGTGCAASTRSSRDVGLSQRPAGRDATDAHTTVVRHAVSMTERNVLGGDLEPCGTDPLTGFYRDGCCSSGPDLPALLQLMRDIDDLGSHTICAVVTAEFLDHQRSIGNDLSAARPEFRFPGLTPGDRWCVTAVNWARAHHDGAAAPVVLAATNIAVLRVVPLATLQEHAVDVPIDPRSLEA